MNPRDLEPPEHLTQDDAPQGTVSRLLGAVVVVALIAAVLLSSLMPRSSSSAQLPLVVDLHTRPTLSWSEGSTCSVAQASTQTT